MIPLVPLTHAHHTDPRMIAVGLALGVLYAIVWVLTNALEATRSAIADIFDDGGQEPGDVWDREFDDPRVADVWRRWAADELTEREAEERVATLIDRPRRELRELLETTDGIGPETSAVVASRYESVGELRDADLDELEEIPGVGPTTRELISEAAEEDPPTIERGKA